MKHNLCRTLLLFAGVFLFATIDAHFKTTPQSPVHITETDELVYKSYPNGDRIPDFSFCGYRQSEYPIPWVDAKVYVPVVDGASWIKSLPHPLALMACDDSRNMIYTC